MALPTKMRRRGAWPGLEGLIRQFSLDPEKRLLGEAINSLGTAVKSAFVDVEKNVSDAIDAIVSNRKPAWTATTVNAGTYQAQLWDFVVVNGACTILFPIPSPSNRGAEIAVAKTGAYSISIQPVSGLINGSPISTDPSSNQAIIFISSGEGWHSA